MVLNLEPRPSVPPGLCPWPSSDLRLGVFRPRSPAPDSNRSVWQHSANVPTRLYHKVLLESNGVVAAHAMHLPVGRPHTAAAVL
eukprot:8434407-Pyramimonas_sp.AAC.1